MRKAYNHFAHRDRYQLFDTNTDKTAAQAATAPIVAKLVARKVAETANEKAVIQTEIVIKWLLCVVW